MGVEIIDLVKLAHQEKRRKVIFNTPRCHAWVHYYPNPGEKDDMKSWKDPEFHENWKKMTHADASPLMPEELEELVKTIPRDPEDIKLYNRIAGAEPLPKR